MSEEDLQLLITLDDPGNAEEGDTFSHLQAENTVAYWPGQPFPARGRHDHRAEAKFAQEDAKVEGLMNPRATSVRNHCPARASVAIDAPLGPATYARMFSELPSFEADEQFLHALGRSGGLCDCGDIDDSPDLDRNALKRLPSSSGPVSWKC